MIYDSLLKCPYLFIPGKLAENQLVLQPNPLVTDEQMSVNIFTANVVFGHEVLQFNGRFTMSYTCEFLRV